MLCSIGDNSTYIEEWQPGIPPGVPEREMNSSVLDLVMMPPIQMYFAYVSRGHLNSNLHTCWPIYLMNINANLEAEKFPTPFWTE